MRLKTRPIEVSDETGFDPKIDIFERIEIGSRLASLLENTDEGLIIGIDGAWGEGKSTFAKMLRGYLKNERGITTIYFDAFENDYQKDPFIAIVSQIIQQTTIPKTKIDEFKKSALNVTKTLAKGALRIGIKTATAGALDETIFDKLGTADDIAESTSTLLDKILLQKLDSSREEKESLENFKKELASLAISIGNGKPTTFIIDELDRCRPDYCVDLLEQLKHLFTVKNLNFLIVTNKNQLSASIKNKYGQEINPHLYLQKFFDLWTSLPKNSKKYESDQQKYLDFLLPRLFDEGEKIRNNLIFKSASEIFKSNETTFRGIEKTLSYITIMYNSSSHEFYDHYQVAIAVICYCKAETPHTITALTKTLDHKYAIAHIFPKHDPDESGLVEYIKELVEFCLSNKENKQRIMAESRFLNHSRETPNDNTFASVAKALENMKL